MLACEGEPADTGCSAELIYLDEDQDGFGVDAVWARACLEAGWSTQAGDCDDGDASQHPEGEAPCDCGGSSQRHDWFEDLDRDGYGAGEPSQVCQAAEGWVRSDGDCAPQDATIHPGAEEVWYDDVDQDCDGSDDQDADGDGWPLEEDCDDDDSDVHPEAQEICDDAGADEDCDGLVNGDDPDALGWRTWYLDQDGDGHGVDTETIQACGPTLGYAGTDDDCDDEQAAVSPSAEEVCGTGLDEDCDDEPLECGLEGRLYADDGGLQAQGISTLGWKVAGIELGGQLWVLVTAPSTNSSMGSVMRFPAALEGELELPGDASWHIDGAAATDSLGSAMVALDERFAVSAPWQQSSGRGVVYLLGGDEASLDEAPTVAGRVGDSGSFGSQLAASPDLNDDGLDELVVADPYSSFTVSYGGEVSVYLSPHSEDTDVYAAFATVSGTSGQQLGGACLAVGDLYGDGLPELVVGAPSLGGGGRVSVWELGSGGRIDREDYDVQLSGEADQGLGDSCVTGDWDDDGLDDLIVGHSGKGYGAIAYTGGVFESARLIGNNDRAGQELLLPGDLDGDGSSELVIGAPLASFSGASQAGAAYVHWGPASGVVVLSDLDGLLGSTSSDRVGESLGSAGDIDGDGDVELLLGLPYRSRTGQLGGGVLIAGGPGI